MRRTTLIIAFAVAVALLVAVPVAGMAMTDSSADENETEQQSDELPEQANDTAPGERLSGIVGVQAAELEGDLEGRTFGIQVAQAASEGAQADVVGERLGDIDERLADLEARNETLHEQRDAGEISEGQYRAGMAVLVAESRATAQLANQTEHVAGQLPADVLEERGVDVDALQTLKDRAANLTGEDVAAIAQDIAGPAVGDLPSDGPPIDLPVGDDERPGDRPDDERPGGPPSDGDDADDGDGDDGNELGDDADETGIDDDADSENDDDRSGGQGDRP